MKKKIAWMILIICVILLALVIYLFNNNEIKHVKSDVEVDGKMTLLLNKEYEKVTLPHLNIKGIIKDIDTEKIIIKLSENSNKYLETNEIILKNKNYNLKENDKVFIKINGINIDKNELNYSEIELYKFKNNIEKTNEKKDYFICKNSYGEKIKITGTSFKYNGNKYFLADQKIDENNEIYFLNIENGTLLIEDYKDEKFPHKVYNMVNPQETMFEKIIEIYSMKGDENGR